MFILFSGRRGLERVSLLPIRKKSACSSLERAMELESVAVFASYCFVVVVPVVCLARREKIGGMRQSRQFFLERGVKDLIQNT